MLRLYAGGHLRAEKCPVFYKNHKRERVFHNKQYN
jgi:hypothetical protein